MIPETAMKGNLRKGGGGLTARSRRPRPAACVARERVSQHTSGPTLQRRIICPEGSGAYRLAPLRRAACVGLERKTNEKDLAPRFN